MNYEDILEENKKLKEELSKLKNNVKKGDIIKLKNELVSTGSVQSFSRPYLVVSNDVGNHYSNICLCVPLTSQNKKMTQPTHTRISYHNSVALCEQIHTINQKEIEEIKYHLPDYDVQKINECLKVSLNIN